MVFRDPEDGSKPASEAEISEAAGIFTPMANLMSGAAAAIGVADGQVGVKMSAAAGIERRDGGGGVFF